MQAEHWPASGVASTVAGEIAEVVNILCWCLRSMFVTKAVNGVGAGRPMICRTAARYKYELITLIQRRSNRL